MRNNATDKATQNNPNATKEIRKNTKSPVNNTNSQHREQFGMLFISNYEFHGDVNIVKDQKYQIHKQ